MVLTIKEKVMSISERMNEQLGKIGKNVSIMAQTIAGKDAEIHGLEFSILGKDALIKSQAITIEMLEKQLSKV